MQEKKDSNTTEGAAAGLRDLNSEDLVELFPGLKVRFVHTNNVTLAHWEIDQGADLPSHSHPHEQIVNMISGTFELRVEGSTYTLEPGQVFIIPGNAEHSGCALSDCKIIDVFHPVREDYL